MSMEQNLCCHLHGAIDVNGSHLYHSISHILSMCIMLISVTLLTIGDSRRCARGLIFGVDEP